MAQNQWDQNKDKDRGQHTPGQPQNKGRQGSDARDQDQAGGRGDESGSGRGDLGSQAPSSGVNAGSIHQQQARQGQSGLQQRSQEETASGMPGRGQLGANQDEPLSESDTERLSGRNANDDIGDGNNSGRGMGRDR